MSNKHAVSTETGYAATRAAMVVSQLRPNGVTDVRLLAAMGSVAREDFVPQDRRSVAYADRPVPLSPGRAMNPPMTTARLFNALKIGSDERLLIIGAATGYSAAIGSELCASVTAIEEDAALIALVPTGVSVVQGALADGASANAPFDAILIDGAVEAIPETLVAQLADEGRLAAAILTDGVTRLVVGRRGGNSFATTDLVDAESVVLPGFAPAREFVF